MPASARPVTAHLSRLSWPLRLTVAAGLAVDAYIHADLAVRYDLNQGAAVISQGDLFRIEAGVASLAAVVILITDRALAWLFAAVVAGSALGAILLFRYYDGAIGPLPNMYEPMMFPEKTLAAIAEAVAAAAALAGLGIRVLTNRQKRAAGPVVEPARDPVENR